MKNKLQFKFLKAFLKMGMILVLLIISFSIAKAQSSAFTITDKYSQEAPNSPQKICPAANDPVCSVGFQNIRRTIAFFLSVYSQQNLTTSTTYPEYAVWGDCNSASNDYNSIKAQCGTPKFGPANVGVSGKTYSYSVLHPEGAYPPLTASYEANGTYNAKICLLKKGNGISATSATTAAICSSIPVRICDMKGISGCSASASTSKTPTPVTPSLTAQISGGVGGTVPYRASYNAYATSTGTGNFNYYFYCNRSDNGTSISPPSPIETALAKLQPTWAMANTCTYNTPGVYSPKVIVNQGSLSAENRKQINVSPFSTNLSTNLIANPSPSDISKTVTLSANTSSNNINETFNYSFWWNCSSTATNYAQAVADCGDPTIAAKGAKFSNLSSSTVTKSVQHLYNRAGDFKPKVIVEQGNSSAAASQLLKVEDVFNVTLTSTADVDDSQKITLAATLNDPATQLTSLAKTSYTFWWNCSGDIGSTTYEAIKGVCGEPELSKADPVDPTQNAIGRRFENIWTGNIADGTRRVVNYKTTQKWDYQTGQVQAVVLVERGVKTALKKISFTVAPRAVIAPSPSPSPSLVPSPSPSPSQAARPSPSPSIIPSPSPSVTVIPEVIPSLDVNLNLSPAQSSPGESVTLSAITNTNTQAGNYSYYFWWNCDLSSFSNPTLSDALGRCNSPTVIANGIQFVNQNSSVTTKTADHIYVTAGSYKPLVYVEHAGVKVFANASQNVVKPSLTAGLSINPTVADGSAKPATLSATASGTALGTVNYTFWWDCNEPGTDISALTTKCGNPLDSSKGAKYTENSNQKIVNRDYIQSGTFYPKVVVERGSADPQEARTQIIVNSVSFPILDVSLGALKTSSDNVLPAIVEITANISGSTTGETKFKIWWDCQPNSSDPTQIEQICGDTSNSAKGIAQTSTADATSIKVSTSYSLSGLRHPFVLAERQSIKSSASTEINISPVIVQDTLSAVLTSTSANIKKGDTVNLTATTQSNNSKDSYNYYFWWDCPSADSKVLSDVVATCLDPSDPSRGKVFLNQSSSTKVKELAHKYTTSGTVHPRVFVEHGTVSANTSYEILVSDLGIEASPVTSLVPSGSLSFSKPVAQQSLNRRRIIPMTLDYSGITAGQYYVMISACPKSFESSAVCPQRGGNSELLTRDVNNKMPVYNLSESGSLTIDVSLTVDGKGQYYIDLGEQNLGASISLVTDSDKYVWSSVTPVVITDQLSVSPIPSATIKPSPTPSPIPSVVPSPSPSPAKSISPTPGATVKFIYYYSSNYLSEKLTNLSQYEELANTINHPVHDIYLSVDNGVTYKRIEHNIDPMPGAVMSTLPLDIKSIARPWRSSSDLYLKITHNVRIPDGMVTDPSKARLLAYVDNNGTADKGSDFVFPNTAYNLYAGPDAQGRPMDFSGNFKASCDTKSPAPVVVSAVANACYYSFDNPKKESILTSDKLNNLSWRLLEGAPVKEGLSANLYYSKNNGISYKPLITNLSEDEYTHMFTDQDLTKKGKLRIDHYSNGQMYSSCISSNFSVANSGGGFSGGGALPINSKIPDAVNTALILGTLISSIAGIALSAVSSLPFVERAANLAFALFAPPVWPGKKPSWGLVYDSISKRPIKGAFIRIFAEPSGRLKASVKSNINGAFGFILPEGKYSVVASVLGYEFPSKLIIGNTDGRFLSVYKGGAFDVSGDGQQKAQVNINIPMDRSTLTTFDVIHIRTLATITRFFQVIRMPLMILGTISVTYLLFTQHRIADYVIGTLYVILWALQIRNMIKKRAYGIVRDRFGNPVSMALIRATDPRGKLKFTVVTGDDGKFQLFLDPGNYRLDITRGGYRRVRTELFKINNIQDIGRLNLRLDKL